MKILILLLIIANFNLYAQTEHFFVGGNIGGGSIKGNSPNHGTLHFKLYFAGMPTFIKPVSILFGYNFTQKYERFLPGEQERYFPFMHILSLDAVISQNLDKLILLKEGIGIIGVNDRTFSDTDTWGIGTNFLFSANLDFRKNHTGYLIGIGIEYGVTFSSTTPRYYSISLQTEYHFF